jgi:Domain of unknown function (DUF4402)
MPTSVTLTAAGGGGQTMTVSNLTSNLVGGAGNLTAAGTGSFSVGGTLAVGANQAIAVYSGVTPITITWN